MASPRPYGQNEFARASHPVPKSVTTGWAKLNQAEKNVLPYMLEGARMGRKKRGGTRAMLM